MAGADEYREQGDRAMRRSFNKALCVSTPPPKVKPKPIPAAPKKKKKHTTRKHKRKEIPDRRKCNELEILLNDYIEQMGEDYNVKEFAYRCCVAPDTARRWTYGYMPHWYVWWNMAKYFAEYLPVSAHIIHADIEATIHEFKAGL